MTPRSKLWRLLRNWLRTGMTWYALTEVLARIVLEGGFLLVLWLLGLSPLMILFGWLLFHTAAWLFLYGGFMIVWKLLRIRADVARLAGYRDLVVQRLSQEPSLQVAYLRGSAARGELNEHSDIDVLAVPKESIPSKVRALLFWWSLRAEAVVRRMPLEARWVDAERFLPYHLTDESPLLLKRRGERPDRGRRLASEGLLIAFSGIDGSGKTTAAKRLVSTLRDEGYDAVYFYGHRPAYLREGTQVSFAIAFKSFWKRAGRNLAELEHHRWAKIAFDVTTFLDYVYVQWKLSRMLRPGTIVVSDRYVADVIAYMRFLGPVKETVEGLLVRMSREPDVSIFFDIGPADALKRKQEQSLAELQRFAQGYSDLRSLLGFDIVDASTTVDEVRIQVERIIDEGLRLSKMNSLAGAGANPSSISP